ncbi:helix-turn-helix domain-containing protein [Streptomyces ureilyticus]|uniref:Helix-turn-helix domain-containing protein n=1 Tax=Streptomyces ureilyticus TaxID=1775131 RepID=A0ABX0DQZ4_9ACTN|nr:helix-turn-helix domain-containing protein [Streptomyces ureilyticus]NGO43785.1 helix-turn-helix domain-containing protein [Streptomyces ureilyticus]
MKTDPERAERDEEILRLRCAGLSLRAIASRVGLSHQGVADRITAAIAELVTPAAEEWRSLETARLNDLTRLAYGVLAAADTGDLKLKAIDRLTKLSESRRKLWGLDATEPLRVSLERRSDVEGETVAEAVAAVVSVLQLDEERRVLALRAAEAALLGEPLPAPAPVVEQPVVDAEQAKREAEFRRMMAAEGVDADALLDGEDDDDDDQ